MFAGSLSQTTTSCAVPPLAVTTSRYFTIEPAGTVCASAFFRSAMVTFSAGGEGVTGGATGGAGGVTGGAGGGHMSVTVGIEPPLQVAPTVSVPKTGHVWVTAV